MTQMERTAGAPSLPATDRVKDEIKRIQDYVWARHIDASNHYDPTVDEDEAVRILDAYYSEIGNRNSPDQFYLGILLFERAFRHPEQQAELFERARKIFEFYRRVTGETDWPVIEDRLADIREFMEERAREAAAVAEPPPPSPESLAPPPLQKAPEPPPAEPAAATTASAAEDDARRKDAEVAQLREASEAVIAELEVIEGMLLVPAGTFLFGPENREVFVDTFYIDRTPVTNAEYMRFVRETGYRPPRFAEDPLRNRPQQPVVGVSLADAQQYAKWAGKELPTEEQWEKAARGTDGRPYPWGNDPPGASDACFGLDPVSGAPGDVGQWLRNISPFGAKDMCGNVWQWTTTRFRKGSEFHVVKGGSYNDPIEMLRLDFRLEAHPKDKSEALGFRCVKNVHH